MDGGGRGRTTLRQKSVRVVGDGASVPRGRTRSTVREPATAPAPFLGSL